MKLVLILFALLANGKGIEAFPFSKVVAHPSSELTSSDRHRLQRNYPKTLEKIDNLHPLSLQDIKNLTRSGVLDQVIISYISQTRSIFFLQPNDEKELKQAGVSNQVLQAMKDTVYSRY